MRHGHPARSPARVPDPHGGERLADRRRVRIGRPVEQRIQTHCGVDGARHDVEMAFDVHTFKAGCLGEDGQVSVVSEMRPPGRRTR
jgi:hypothetical protein